ncbi:MAG TPA: DUF1778 domain-containing protein [Candidatus Dormibacteraeota bacterium]|nr:DUF1778 domain-containing protein [Candidatus Dormibacteraeota bacterium]
MEEVARRPAKRARLNLRASQRQLELLRLAAEVQGKTLSDFVLGTATERAQEILVEQRHFVASPEAWDEFMRLLEDPPPPSPALVELFRDPDL